MISLGVDQLIVDLADEPAHKAVVSLPRSSLFLGPITESIRREIDTRLPREERCAPPTSLQNSSHAVSERKQATSIGEQCHRVLLIPLGEKKDGPVRTHPLEDNRKFPYRDECDPGGDNDSEFGFKYRDARNKSKKKKYKQTESRDEAPTRKKIQAVLTRKTTSTRAPRRNG